MSDLPHLLVAKREQRGDSQADLAAFINDWMESHGHDMTAPQMTTSQAAISKIEAGLSRPIPRKLPAFAAYLGMSEGQVARAASPDVLGESVAVLREQVIQERGRARQLEMMNEDLLAEVGKLQAEKQQLAAALRKLERRQESVERRAASGTTPAPRRGRSRTS